MTNVQNVPKKNKKDNSSCNQLVFPITKKNSGRFDYQNITWDFSKQITLDKYLEHCKYNFEYGAWTNKIGLRNKGIDYAIKHYNGEIVSIAILNKEDIPKIISQLKNNKLNGINVTVPFKNDFISYVDELSDEARQTNSVNTIYKIENKLIGHNTDIAGFELAIRHCKFNANNKKALILGSVMYVSTENSITKNTPSQKS